MKKNGLLLILFVILIATPLLINSGGAFEGSDGQAEEMITTIDPNYEPWFEPLWEPPSGEIESLLFTLFAVAGSSTIAFYLGTLKGKKHA
ncbi:energy-coupling factor ABC transporter substrate-binding protein [Fusibacter sp. JL298sf-3]